jgi:hypothetical protein
MYTNRTIKDVIIINFIFEVIVKITRDEFFRDEESGSVAGLNIKYNNLR